MSAISDTFRYSDFKGAFEKRSKQQATWNVNKAAGLMTGRQLHQNVSNWYICFTFHQLTFLDVWVFTLFTNWVCRNKFCEIHCNSNTSNIKNEKLPFIILSKYKNVTTMRWKSMEDRLQLQHICYYQRLMPSRIQTAKRNLSIRRPTQRAQHLFSFEYVSYHCTVYISIRGQVVFRFTNLIVLWQRHCSRTMIRHKHVHTANKLTSLLSQPTISP